MPTRWCEFTNPHHRLGTFQRQSATHSRFFIRVTDTASQHFDLSHFLVGLYF
jgi:hypothetical protein